MSTHHAAAATRRRRGKSHSTDQDNLLLNDLMQFFESAEHMEKFKQVIDGRSRVSLRIIYWFVTNYAKQYETQYPVQMRTGILKDLVEECTFKVYHRYKLKLKSYSSKRFDSFCRGDRIYVANGADADANKGTHADAADADTGETETTIGQLNFFKWCIENKVLEYIEAHYEDIERDMNARNSASRRRALDTADGHAPHEDPTAASATTAAPAGPAGPAACTTTKKRKPRQELSVVASKCIRREHVHITVKFDN
jgi:hypothetical protein